MKRLQMGAMDEAAQFERPMNELPAAETICLEKKEKEGEGTA